MKVDFSQTFRGVNGDGLTLGAVASAALNAQAPNQREPLDLATAMKRGDLALRVMEGGEHEISVDDAALVRSLLTLAWAPVIVAQAGKMLEG
jgi:hypothetical protein